VCVYACELCSVVCCCSMKEEVIEVLIMGLCYIGVLLFLQYAL
jgi:hypothetical protein